MIANFDKPVKIRYVRELQLSCQLNIQESIHFFFTSE